MKGRKSVVVELTPLLDVIFILLFLVLVKSNEQARITQEEAVKAREQAEASALTALKEKEAMEGELEKTLKELSGSKNEVKELSEALEEAEDRVDSYQVLEEITAMISLDIHYEPDGTRKVTISDASVTERTSYDWDSIPFGENYIRSSLKRRLSALNEKEVVVVMIHYDGNYVRDYELLYAVAAEVQSSTERIYVRFR